MSTESRTLRPGMEEEQQTGIVVSEKERNKKKELEKELQKKRLAETVDEAKRLIIKGDIEVAISRAFETLQDSVKIFGENSIELLPGYFVLAEANICFGGERTKKAEEFLIAAYWNLLKHQNDEGGQGKSDKITERDLSLFRSNLHKMFGRLFLAQKRHEDAKNELSQGIYLESIEYGPENVMVCSSYYYMGCVFQQTKREEGASSFFQKVMLLWKNYIMKIVLEGTESQVYNEYVYEEARNYLKDIVQFMENQYGPASSLFGDSLLSYALIQLKLGNIKEAYEYSQEVLNVYSNSLGDYDTKTKEVNDLLLKLEGYVKQIQNE